MPTQSPLAPTAAAPVPDDNEPSQSLTPQETPSPEQAPDTPMPAGPQPTLSPTPSATVQTTLEDALTQATATIDPSLTPDASLSMTPTISPTMMPTLALVEVEGLALYQHHEPDESGIELQVFIAEDIVLSSSITDSEGVFVLLVPVDVPYQLAAHADLHLAEVYDMMPGEPLPEIVLIGGDINGNGCIGKHDLIALFENYNLPDILDTDTTGDDITDASDPADTPDADITGASDPADTPGTDITGDGITDASDLAILTGNFDPACETGPLPTPDSELSPTPDFTLTATPTLDQTMLTPDGTQTGTVSPTPTLSEPVQTLTETVTVTPTPTEMSAPVGLPFYDSFDGEHGESGWVAGGAWQIDAETAYNGTGWFADSAQRDAFSTLEYENPFDLSGENSPQLTFWQKGELSTGDILTIEISLDGGMSWQTVDQQTGLTTDWAVHTVDLYLYRGQMARLRFGLYTIGTLPDGETTVGYWLDELVLKHVLLPTMTPTLIDTTQTLRTPSLTPSLTAITGETPVTTPTPTPVPASLPFIQSFDSDLGWTASGSWLIVPNAGFTGNSWFAIGNLRDQNSLLVYDGTIDLQTATKPRMSFWSKADLSAVDVFGVEVSPDDGLTWHTLDLHTEPVTDWVQNTLELTPCQGQVIRLRFRLDTTGVLPENVTTIGLWLDELSIWDDSMPPTATFTPSATPAPGLPTMTWTSSPTVLLEGTPTAIPTQTPLPVSSLMPSWTPTSLPVDSPMLPPTDTPTPFPTATSSPTAIPTEPPPTFTPTTVPPSATYSPTPELEFTPTYTAIPDE
ncbi:MAG: hypothetical protein JW966_12365 [Anaerolineae bacterium]|nr:hypothetical protein [Anaerolineae bacterium]